MERGVVAAGHPETAEAGARVLHEGGNAVDAALCAVLTSCVAESPLTGLGDEYLDAVSKLSSRLEQVTGR